MNNHAFVFITLWHLPSNCAFCLMDVTKNLSLHFWLTNHLLWWLLSRSSENPLPGVIRETHLTECQPAFLAPCIEMSPTRKQPNKPTCPPGRPGEFRCTALGRMAFSSGTTEEPCRDNWSLQMSIIQSTATCGGRSQMSPGRPPAAPVCQVPRVKAAAGATTESKLSFSSWLPFNWGAPGWRLIFQTFFLAPPLLSWPGPFCFCFWFFSSMTIIS